jgi:aspartate/methionine/tyrosine aminotransferase
LRQAIAETYQDHSADDILVVVPEEGIFLLMHALLEPGDHVVSTFPGYQSLYEIARSIGCDVSLWKPIEEDGWSFSMNQLKRLLRPNTKLVVVNFPHNPTGFVPSAEDYSSLIDLVSHRGIYLLSDEMYRFLEIDEKSNLPAGCELYHKAVSLSGLSKSYGLPGLRIGWIATQNHDLIARMSLLKDYTTICASAPSEILALFALMNRDAIISGNLQRIKRNLGLLDDFFNDYSDCFQWNRPLGGSICFPRFLLPGGATKFCDELVENAGIMLAPSSVFQYGDDHVRIGFGRDNLPEVIGHFQRYLDQRYRSS